MRVLFIHEFLQICNAVAPFLIGEILLSIFNILILLDIQEQHDQLFGLNFLIFYLIVKILEEQIEEIEGEQECTECLCCRIGNVQSSDDEHCDYVEDEVTTGNVAHLDRLFGIVVVHEKTED